MKPATAAAIARRIGLTTDYWPGLITNSGGLRWQDGSINFPLDELDHYLASGDRPLRVARAYAIGVLPSDVSISSGQVTEWVAHTFMASIDEYVYAAEPEAAILACAAAIEGEGYE